jgi:hypothetical protein
LLQRESLTYAPVSPVQVALARRQWEEGNKRFDEQAREQPRLLDALEVVTDELRRRIGQTFTLGELASAYDRADDWARVAIGDRAPFPGWPRSITTIEEAAFHRYSRGATDYTP